MRVYYIFLINRETYMLTKNKPDNLYKILESIYLLDKNKVSKMFQKIFID